MVGEEVFGLYHLCSIFFTLLAMGTGRRWLVLTLYFVSLAATLLLFNHHATSQLDLNF